MDTLNGIMEDAKLCSYAYVSKHGIVKQRDCEIADSCPNNPNGCTNCETVVRLHLIRRAVAATSKELNRINKMLFDEKEELEKQHRQEQIDELQRQYTEEVRRNAELRRKALFENTSTFNPYITCYNRM